MKFSARGLLLIPTLVLAALPAAAQRNAPPVPPAPEAWQPPTLTFPGERITLLEAVRLTLAHEPTIRLKELSSRSQRGAWQVEAGQFDPIFDATASYIFTQDALKLSQINQEKKTRSDIQKDIDEERKKADALLPGLTEAITELTKLKANPDTYVSQSLTIRSIQLQVTSLNQQIAVETNPLKKDLLIRSRNDLISTNLALDQNDLQHLRDNQNAAQTRLDKLGPVPTIEQTQTASLDLRVSVPNRDGVTLGLFGTGSWSRDRYKGKDKKGEDGGLGIEDVWNAEIGFSLDAHLLRGRGADATDAFEISAGIDYEASRLVLQHAVSQAVFNTVSAYWNLVAAQELLDVSRKSSDLHGRRLEVTKGLIEGDEIPRAELPRELASQATDQALVMSAERQVNEARIQLARAMGLSVEQQANAPLAADPFPTPAAPEAIAALTPAELLATAHDRRYDRLASVRLLESGGVLLRQAQTALRPLLDFSGQISAKGVSETSLARLPNGWAAPSFQVSLTFEKPVGNNAARGAVLQSEADLAQRNISARDLGRTIDLGVVQVLYSLRATVGQLMRVSEAVGYYGQTIETENEKFRMGQTALIDAIATQDLQTNAMFTYATAKQQYATLLARLRFETGTLVYETKDGTGSVRAEDLVTIPARSGK